MQRVSSYKNNFCMGYITASLTSMCIMHTLLCCNIPPHAVAPYRCICCSGDKDVTKDKRKTMFERLLMIVCVTLGSFYIITCHIASVLNFTLPFCSLRNHLPLLPSSVSNSSSLSLWSQATWPLLYILLAPVAQKLLVGFKWDWVLLSSLGNQTFQYFQGHSTSL